MEALLYEARTATHSFGWMGGLERFGSTLGDIARTAEEAGFDRIAVADHVWQHPMVDSACPLEHRAALRRRLYVLVEAEQVGRVILVLQGD
jgi:alkanesulfonate monooxygenase SsuD/methylene tetrahydromethanopterin reductase-like flavin-dependent oxidoreductase (luciferase family)